jgi:hypothetical protein
MTSHFGAIETVYRGVTFRSRLEAKWAAFFDLCQWKWEYEPIDLNGYIPDFILTFPNAPILVEVKPALYLKDLCQFTEKIDASGWDKESMVVGASMFDCDFGDESAIGILKEIRSQRDVEFGCPDNCWAPAVFQKCQNCEYYSFYHQDWTYNCRVNGCYEGDHFIGSGYGEHAKDLFAGASRSVRWEPRR